MQRTDVRLLLLSRCLAASTRGAVHLASPADDGAWKFRKERLRIANAQAANVNAPGRPKRKSP